jgi:hypothetical protein
MFSKWNAKFGRICFKIFLIIHENLIQKCDVLKKSYVSLVTYYKRFHPKSPFYEKVKMTTKRTIVLESLVTIGSFDCDCTQYIFTTLLKIWLFNAIMFLPITFTSNTKQS